MISIMVDLGGPSFSEIMIPNELSWFSMIDTAEKYLIEPKLPQRGFYKVKPIYNDGTNGHMPLQEWFS